MHIQTMRNCKHAIWFTFVDHDILVAPMSLVIALVVKSRHAKSSAAECAKSTTAQMAYTK